ncbi:MAG: hypothetical protein JWM36_184 [Hyphomicrobiales bacterium]|nr:hypothetical protein [Hyphomicrobiales bacterium]
MTRLLAPRRCRIGIALLAGLLAVAGNGSARAASGCSAFQTNFVKEVPDVGASFVRPLVVSRSGQSGEFFDLVTNSRIDGLLQCNGEKLLRFEVKIAMPADAPALARFDSVLHAALRAALGWPATRAAAAVRTMSHEAADYLRASDQRGDVVVAGKTEYHEGGSDLGMIWTSSERTLVIVGSGG